MWYFKGRRKKYKSPYTGKEVDAAVAKAGKLPTVTSADVGMVLGVDDEGNIITTEGGVPEDYPYVTEKIVIPDVTFTIETTSSGAASIDIYGSSTNPEDYEVKIDGKQLTWNEYYFNYYDDETSYSYTVDFYGGNFTSAGVYNVSTEEDVPGDYTLSISVNEKSIDENFEKAVEEITEYSTLPEPTSDDTGKIMRVDNAGWNLTQLNYDQITITTDASDVVSAIKLRAFDNSSDRDITFSTMLRILKANQCCAIQINKNGATGAPLRGLSYDGDSGNNTHIMSIIATPYAPTNARICCLRITLNENANTAIEGTMKYATLS